MEIRTRLTLQFIIVVASFLLVSFLIIYFSIEESRKTRFYKRLNNRAITAAELLFRVERVDSSLLKLISRTERDRLNNENISIFNFENRLLYTNNDTIHDAKDLGITPQLLNEIRLEKRMPFSYGAFELLGLVYKFQKKTYVVVAGGIDDYGYSHRENIQIILSFLFFGILILVALAGWIYAGRALAPISSIVNAVEKMSPQKLDERLKPLPNQDEIGRLVLTINHLLERIEAAFQLQRIFVSGASHEMKNPLSAITSQLDVALLRDRSGEEYRETLQSVLEDIRNLNRITHQLMELARLENAQPTILKESVRLDEILWEAGNHLQKRHPEFHILQTVVSLPEDENLLIISGNAPLLQTAFENLAENGCKYSENHTVIIRLSFENKGIKIEFEDTGKGIKNDDLPLVYQPFFRSKETQEIKGTGLGLALVEKIVQLHQGQIFIESEEGKGTTVTLFFFKN